VPTWGEILQEISGALPTQGPAVFDHVRRKYLVLLAEHTKRNTILYATKWTQPGVTDPGLISITAEDVQGLMEVVHGLDGKVGLDLILHSPGGSPDAAEAIVHYLRSKFTHIRVFVPQAAMSAATMVACSADEIVMGKHSSLGPIDPQFIVSSPQGIMALPAQAILDQFELAKEDCKDPALLGAWAPILPLYGPSLLVQCYNALELAEELASEWLQKWMFAGDPKRKKKATAIARRLADHSRFKSHGRPIHRDMAKEMGLKIVDLENDQALQDLVLSVFHATTHTFGSTIAVKIIENQQGHAFVKMQQVNVAAAPNPASAFQPVPRVEPVT
jgi:membrane-bound ClpP family serine protease